MTEQIAYVKGVKRMKEDFPGGSSFPAGDRQLNNTGIYPQSQWYSRMLYTSEA